MMEVYTVSFFGHRQLEHSIEAERRLEMLIRKLLAEREYVEFLVGRNGAFDQLVAATVLRLKRTVRDDNSALVLVLPYLTAEYLSNQDSIESCYDEIEVSWAAADGHFKSAIQTRNREMVDRSDMVICWIERDRGGAYQTMRYARKQGKKTVNMAEQS